MHKNIKFIDMDEKYFDSFFNILEKSFPENERRDYLSQKELLKNKNYKPFVLNEDDEIKAIMATWEFDDFIFIEHFAVDNKLRGKGIGTKLIQNYIDTNNKKIFLEVEPPVNNMTKKRVMFYENLGFHLNDFHYLQQPLNKNDLPLQLNIMSSPEDIKEEDFEKYKKVIYKEVYNV